MEQAFQQRVHHPPIHTLPVETLSRILILATPEDFEFRDSKGKQHPLSTICRAWHETIKATPEIWSRIRIDIETSGLTEDKLRNIESRLKFWLVQATSTLDIEFILSLSFEFQPPPGMLAGMNQVYDHSEPLRAIWLLLLSRIENWQVIQYYGSAYILKGFWEASHRAKRLESGTFGIIDSPIDEVEYVSTLSSYSTHFPRLRSLYFAHHLPPDSVMERMAEVPSMQNLGFREVVLTDGQFASLTSQYPSITKLQLHQVRRSQWGSRCPALPFQSLGTCGLYHPYASAEFVGISALRGCHNLRVLRLNPDVIRDLNMSDPLPSVQHLELEGHTVVDNHPTETDFQHLFTGLPSLKSFKTLPTSTNGYFFCQTKGVLGALLLSTYPGQLPLCPDLSTVCFERALVSNRELVKFVEQRTVNPTPEELDVLQEFGQDDSETPWWFRNTNRPAIYASWMPTCCVTTTGCPTTPDMTDAGLDVLIESLNSGELRVDAIADNAWNTNVAECGYGCTCLCGTYDCTCCEHLPEEEEEEE